MTALCSRACLEAVCEGSAAVPWHLFFSLLPPFLKLSSVLSVGLFWEKCKIPVGSLCGTSRDILLSTKYERYCEYPCISFFFMDKQDGFLEVRLSMKYEPF